MSTPLRKGWCPGALRPMEAKDGLLVRLRLTGGMLSVATAHALADLSLRHGNGLFDLTARANLQMRGVRDAELAPLQDGLHALGLLDASAAGESVRNVIASPLAGLHNGIDVRPLVAALERRLTQDATLHSLPGKFGFLIDDGGWPSLAGIDADVRFEWTGEAFAIGLGGSREHAAGGEICEADETIARAAEIARVFLDFAKQNPEVRRMRDALPSPACRRRWPDAVRSDEGIFRLLNIGRSSGNTPHPTSADAEATFSCKREKESARDIVGLKRLDVSPPLPLVGEGGRQARTSSCLGLAAPFGRLDATMLHAAAETACDDIRLTPWRILLLPGASATHVPGFITDPTDPRLSVATCPGVSGCARGSTDTQSDAAALAALLPPSPDIALHISGCEKGCAKPSATPLTLVTRNGRYDLVRDGRAGDTPIHRNLDLDAVQRILALEPA